MNTRIRLFVEMLLISTVFGLAGHFSDGLNPGWFGFFTSLGILGMIGLIIDGAMIASQYEDALEAAKAKRAKINGSYE